MPVDEKGKYREKSTGEMDLNELVRWAKGHLLIEIGNGRFSQAVWDVVSQAYINGKQEGKQEYIEESKKKKK